MNEVNTTMGSYHEKDVTFLLKDLSAISMERTTEAREKAIQSGVHYSEMLPIEYKPTNEYLQLFHESLKSYKQKVAIAVAVVAEQILEARGFNTVLCSLARAGTPIGVLIKRYVQFKYNKELPHYSISIIRDKGIDVNAINYILKNHPKKNLTFVDGWTGKGAITKQLQTSINLFNEQNGTNLSPEIAVLADPGYCATLYGTRDDFLIPSACLNSTVSGLVSRTVLNEKWIGVNDFHGAKYYSELISEDVSNHYIDTIANQFPKISEQINVNLKKIKQNYQEPTWKGLESIKKIQADFGINNTHLIKPGVGETTRVLLRRIPWKILIKPNSQHLLQHILLLAKDRGVQVYEYDQMSYNCCGLINPMEK
ncbi:cysteine protease StiP family protein [Radiobacillus sp. PE A8.2]|uniref:cysteine protease StiP family protein n=1 Tax=Radiobacillus sp. PE A8.2 TaxID=3380349 RepID=UPI00388DDB51